MNLFGIGGPELIFLLILIFLLLGPEESVKVARGLGRALRFVYRSTLWRVMVRMRHEFEHLVREEIRRAGIPEDLQQLKDWQRSLVREMEENPVLPHPPGAVPAASMTPSAPGTSPKSEAPSTRDHESTPSA